MSSSEDCLPSQGGASLCDTSPETSYAGCRSLLCSKPLNCLVCHTYMPCAVYILRLTGGVLGAGVLHVTKDLVPCACLPARVRRNAGKNKGRLKRVFGQHFLASQVTHRPTVGQDWSEWAVLRLSLSSTPPKLLQVI